jgi:RNA polymerase sigma-70 factor, ECF subfamily
MRRRSVSPVRCPSRLIEIMDAAAYERLRLTARKILRTENASPRWDAADLAHEAFVRIARSQPPIEFSDAGHFHAIAVLTMKRVLIDRARAARARGGGQSEPLVVEATVVPEKDWNAIAVQDALGHLAEQGGRRFLVVKMRFYWGFELDEIAAALSLSTRTVKRDWTAARVWLRHALELGHGHRRAVR